MTHTYTHTCSRNPQSRHSCVQNVPSSLSGAVLQQMVPVPLPCRLPAGIRLRLLLLPAASPRRFRWGVLSLVELTLPPAQHIAKFLECVPPGATLKQHLRNAEG